MTLTHPDADLVLALELAFGTSGGFDDLYEEMLQAQVDSAIADRGRG